METLIDLAWGAAAAVLLYAGGMAGIVVADARSRRRGQPIDAGMFALHPGDPGYYTGIRLLDGPSRP